MGTEVIIQPGDDVAGRSAIVNKKKQKKYARSVTTIFKMVFMGI